MKPETKAKGLQALKNLTYWKKTTKVTAGLKKLKQKEHKKAYAKAYYASHKDHINAGRKNRTKMCRECLNAKLYAL